MARTRSGADTREALVSAAVHTFARQGPDHTPVSDIVKAAGVAQGTFYIYFRTKEQVLEAVVERLAGEVVQGVEALACGRASAVEKLRSLCGTLGRMAAEPDVREVVEIVHSPGGRRIHERMVAQALPRLAGALKRIVEQGVAEGTFHVRSPAAAAWFVLAGLQGSELSGLSLTEMPGTLTVSAELALRALGFAEAQA